MIHPSPPSLPSTITIHLGKPSQQARNITIPLVDYLKIIASCIVYPSWPDSALRACICTQVSYVLHQLYSECYRRLNHSYDMTASDPDFGLCFVEGRTYYEPISRIVDEIFNNYLVPKGSSEPLSFGSNPAGTYHGLALWDSVLRAGQKETPYQILTDSYGQNTEIIYNAPISDTPVYPGKPLQMRSSSVWVHQIQLCLNRISTYYPIIDKIYPENGIFNAATSQSVAQFQKIFDLEPDGIVGKATWYRIFFVYQSIHRLSQQNLEDLIMQNSSFLFPGVLQAGSSGNSIKILQHFLRVLHTYFDEIPPASLDGHYNKSTKQAVTAAQRLLGLIPTGMVNRETWDALLKTYQILIKNLSSVFKPTKALLSHDAPLRYGMNGENIRLLQTYLEKVSHSYPEICDLSVTGHFGNQTQSAVSAFQGIFCLKQTGTVDAITWDTLADTYAELEDSSRTAENQYPGYPIGGKI